MDEKIKQHLIRIQQEKNIEILLACETGSRAWGFPSPDSDYDVRFIYRHTSDWYLRINDAKDTIEYMTEDRMLDFSGWDLKKSLQLLWKSNPAMLERVQSPIMYIENTYFVNEMLTLSQSMYSKVATMHHYLSMAKKMYAELEGKSEVKLKKLFYVLRATMACVWILEKETIPPIVFQKMLEELIMPIEYKKEIYALIERKSTTDEQYLHPVSLSLFQWITMNLERATMSAPSLSGGKGEIEALNEFFRKMLK